MKTIIFLLAMGLSVSVFAGQSLKNKTELINATTTASASGSSVTMQDNLEGMVGTLVASSVGGTSPTFDVKIQHSDDGSNWYDLVSFTQVTADSTELKAISADVLQFVRYDVVVGGTATPTADLILNLNYNNKRRND